MGQTMTQLLDTMRLPHRTLSEETAVQDFQWVAKGFMKDRVPLALLLKKGIVKGIHP